MPFLPPPVDETTRPYADLIGLGLDPAVGFTSKREPADEFGWRHFGDFARQAWFVRQPALPDPPRPLRPRVWPLPTPFIPQKVIAMARAKRLAVGVVATGILLTGWLLCR